MTTACIPAPDAQRIPALENAFKFVLLLVLLLASFVLADALMHRSGWPLWLRLPLVLGLAAGNGLLLIGFGVLSHEAVHRVLFRNAFLNALIGGLAGALMLTPFHANRQFHLTHHSYAHQPGLDPENAMHERPFWQAMTIGSLLGLWLQYRILLANAARAVTQPRYRVRVLLDTLFLALAAGFYMGLPLALGLDWRVGPLATVLVFPPVFAFRALSDHYGLPAVPRKSQQRQDIEDGSAWVDGQEPARVSGWVIETHPLLEWLWSHVNYHEVHHKYPWLAHCHLPTVYEQTRDRVPYRVGRGYWRSLCERRRQAYYPPAP